MQRRISIPDGNLEGQAAKAERTLQHSSLVGSSQEKRNMVDNMGKIKKHAVAVLLGNFFFAFWKK